MSTFKKAQEYKDEMVKFRRHLHQNPEIELELSSTVAFVKEKLIEMGYEPISVGVSGIVANVGNKDGKTVLLRADMDALPMKEDSELSFSSNNNFAHTCGHDLHTAYLLGAAKILKEKENSLLGNVKLMFQPAEEVGQGALDMINAGVLENPKVDVAFATHVKSHVLPYTATICKGPAMASTDGFVIKITGKGGHGSSPYECVDPINIGVHIHLALQELKSRETPFNSSVSLTVGTFNAGNALNILPQNASLSGTLRTLDPELRSELKKRIVEVAKSIAKTYRGTAEVEFIYEIPVTKNDEKISSDVENYLKNIDDLNLDVQIAPPNSGSEDFSYILEKVPGTMLFLGASFPDKEVYPMHHPKVLFNEEVLPIGATVLAELAIKWLEDNK